jgi:hypothetical protein
MVSVSAPFPSLLAGASLRGGAGDPAVVLSAGPCSFSSASPAFVGAPLGACGLGASPPFPDAAAATTHDATYNFPDPYCIGARLAGQHNVMADVAVARIFSDELTRMVCASSFAVHREPASAASTPVPHLSVVALDGLLTITTREPVSTAAPPLECKSTSAVVQPLAMGPPVLLATISSATVAAAALAEALAAAKTEAVKAQERLRVAALAWGRGRIAAGAASASLGLTLAVYLGTTPYGVPTSSYVAGAWPAAGLLSLVATPCVWPRDAATTLPGASSPAVCLGALVLSSSRFPCSLAILPSCRPGLHPLSPTSL